MSNCGCKRVKDPSGVWGYDNLIGAKVKVTSLAAWNITRMKSPISPCTIKDIFFRVATDGNAITVIELEEYPGNLYTWKDLQLLSEIENPMKEEEKDPTVPEFVKEITEENIESWNNKQDAIEDLEEIRGKANSALQELPITVENNKLKLG